jgi:hypothetical protein
MSYFRFFQGMKNENSLLMQAGELEPEDREKRALKFDEYCQATMAMYNGLVPIGQYHTALQTELPLFTILAWNLMARSDTVSRLHATFIDWEEDAMMIGVTATKRHYREEAEWYHVFANPFRPNICPVLALAVHLACNPTIVSKNG